MSSENLLKKNVYVVKKGLPCQVWVPMSFFFDSEKVWYDTMGFDEMSWVMNWFIKIYFRDTMSFHEMTHEFFFFFFSLTPRKYFQNYEFRLSTHEFSEKWVSSFFFFYKKNDEKWWKTVTLVNTKKKKKNSSKNS